MKNVVGLTVSTNTIERVTLEVGNDLAAAEQAGWSNVLTGEVSVPSLAIVSFDGGRIRTRRTGCGPGVHRDSKGWNESKNAIFVSATSKTSDVDPQPFPPACFLDRDHVAKLTEQAKVKPNRGVSDIEPSDPQTQAEAEVKPETAAHKPKRILRTVISSRKNLQLFGHQMKREATRRRFDRATRKAYVADGLTCNWTIHAEHFADYVPVLDFIHAVSYLFTASLMVFGKTETAWEHYSRWMTLTWQGRVGDVIAELHRHHVRLDQPDQPTNDSPWEQLRKVIGYLVNNRQRMKYDAYRMAGLPTTSAWMESAVKEINYHVKGTEMFWNNPTGAEAILQIRAAALSDDDRLVRALTRRQGKATLRTAAKSTATAA